MMYLSRRSMLGAVSMTALAATLAACGEGADSAGSGSGSNELTIAISESADSSIRKTFQQIIKDFQKANPDIKVTMDPASTNYEADMKVKMAANDLPDVFATHGWSVKRYSEFLAPLTDEAWAKDVNKLLDSSMRDKDGQLYAFPVQLDMVGLVYNADVLSQAGVDPASLATWDDFDAACAKIVAAGKAGLFAYAKDAGYPGNLVNLSAYGFYDDDQLGQLQDGTFAEDSWKGVAGLISTWQKKGYVNKDYTSATPDDCAKALAQGNAGFALINNTLAMDALSYNPDAKIAYVPIPGSDIIKPYMVGGEGQTALGVAKNGNVEAAKKFLTYLAQPEVAATLVAGTGSPSGLTTVKADLGSLTDSYTKVQDDGVELKPYFDRTYLPNGMWSTLCTAVDSLLTGQGTPQTTLEQVKAEFTSLYGQSE